MAKAITRFFEGLGFPVRNVQWSWGSRSGDRILLRTWIDEYSGKDRKVVVLLEPIKTHPSESHGLSERIEHLQALWQGGITGYTVIAEAVDPLARVREIKAYRDDVVFAISRLEARPDGVLVAALGDLVPIGKLNEHSLTHRTTPGKGSFSAP